MKLLSAALLLSLVVLAPTAVAQQDMQRGRDFLQGRRHGQKHQLMPGQSDPRPSRENPLQRFPGEGPGVQQVIEQRTEPLPMPGRERLTPEERQQLRRDINAAGKDIYRQTRTE